MAEPNLHGYFNIEDKLFLVRKSLTSMFELLPFLLQPPYDVAADGYDDIPEALEHVPRVTLDRRSTSLLATLPTDAAPVNVYNSIHFRKRNILHFKGMDGVFCISQEYLEGCQDPVDIGEAAFPLDEYSRAGHGNVFRGENHFSFLNVMKARCNIYSYIHTCIHTHFFHTNTHSYIPPDTHSEQS